MNAYFLEPVDVLFLRGNRLFGDPGSYGESLVPPWPSVAAGALRTAILVRDGVALDAFARGAVNHPTLGTPDAPGEFRITGFHLAWHGETGKGPLERLYPLPADLVATRENEGEGGGEARIALHPLRPRDLEPGIECSAVTTRLPVLAQPRRAKPATGLWLTEEGFRRWLRGELPDVHHHLVSTNRLWLYDERIGIGLDRTRRRADEGKLFTMQAVAMEPGVGFVATVAGDALDEGSLVRLGGDGRGAVVHRTECADPMADLDVLAAEGRCRLVLTTPGLFPGGWRPPGMAEDGSFELAGVRGRIRCAAVPRAEVVSGWDLARWRPKPAERTAPAGSVYWIEDLEATPEQLRKLVAHGLWSESGYDAQRRAEGFNRFTLATY
ncbi:MAG: type III-B CRISPR module-associated protein Cmr3 [Gammaproteobacteria bacterium]|nr:MAG: type III-B CRISPR module-associated protein Cmr3 [Gammaproteobacteria bacterium]